MCASSRRNVTFLEDVAFPEADSEARVGDDSINKKVSVKFLFLIKDESFQVCHAVGKKSDIQHFIPISHGNPPPEKNTKNVSL